MGTTESIFYEEEEDKADVSPPTQPSASAAAPRRAPRRPHGPSANSVRKPPPIAVRLSGILLGLAESGKRTLLQRLEGKDPFLDTDQTLERRTEIVIPYVTHHEVWGDRIQLDVQVARNVQEPVDFAVLLLNPTHEPKKVEAYLGETIQSLLTAQGYGDDKDDSSTSQQTQKRPVCLCLLLNFRDLEEESASNAPSVIQESDVQSWTLSVLEDCHSLEPDRLVLQCGSTSLLNCYGLGLLHHFIYQSYLQRKQCDLEEAMKRVHHAQVQTRRAPIVSYDEFLAIAAQSSAKNASSVMEPSKRRDDTSLHKQRSRGDEKKASSSRQKHRSKAPESIQAQGDAPTGDGRRRRRRQVIPSSTTTEPEETMPSNGRMAEVEQKPPATTQINSKDALEAFLASDDEDDYDGQPRSGSKQPANAKDSDEDDDEDDFFYDETGRQRHMHPTSVDNRKQREAMSASTGKPTKSKAKRTIPVDNPPSSSKEHVTNKEDRTPDRLQNGQSSVDRSDGNHRDGQQKRKESPTPPSKETESSDDGLQSKNGIRLNEDVETVTSRRDGSCDKQLTEATQPRSDGPEQASKSERSDAVIQTHSSGTGDPEKNVQRTDEDGTDDDRSEGDQEHVDGDTDSQGDDAVESIPTTRNEDAISSPKETESSSSRKDEMLAATSSSERKASAERPNTDSSTQLSPVEETATTSVLHDSGVCVEDRKSAQPAKGSVVSEGEEFVVEKSCEGRPEESESNDVDKHGPATKTDEDEMECFASPDGNDSQREEPLSNEEVTTHQQHGLDEGSHEQEEDEDEDEDEFFIGSNNLVTSTSTTKRSTSRPSSAPIHVQQDSEPPSKFESVSATAAPSDVNGGGLSDVARAVIAAAEKEFESMVPYEIPTAEPVEKSKKKKKDGSKRKKKEKKVKKSKAASSVKL